MFPLGYIVTKNVLFKYNNYAWINYAKGLFGFRLYEENLKSLSSYENSRYLALFQFLYSRL